MVKPITVSVVNRKDGKSSWDRLQFGDYSMTDGERYISPKDKMNKYAKDKERIDQITEIIANQQPVKEWVVIYWLAVAVGHILEWMVRQMKPGDINEDGKEIEQDMNITWEEFNETLSDTQKILSVVSAGTEQSRSDSE